MLEDLENLYPEEAELLRQDRIRYQQQIPPKLPPLPPKPIIVEKPFEWRKILDIPFNQQITLELIKIAYRKEAKNRHPDIGGSLEKMVELFKARDEACKSIGINTHEHFK